MGGKHRVGDWKKVVESDFGKRIPLVGILQSWLDNGRGSGPRWDEKADTCEI